jgi:maltose/moltooligosaccharide transporter
MQKPRLSFWQIWNMSFGFLGIQFGWGLQMANMSPIYKYLGASDNQIPMLWLAAPLTGFIVQPIIGAMSDRTWGPLGRRRPYFLIGAILSSLALILMPNCSTLWMAAGLLWILDASINVSMEPFRAFVADKLPEEQRGTGFAMQSFFIGVGAVVAGMLPWILKKWFHVSSDTSATSAIPLNVRIAFYAGAVAFFGAVLWTIFSTREYPPENLEEFRRKKTQTASLAHFFNEIFSALREMPGTMRRLAVVQFFTWLALFCMWIYFSPTVGSKVFGGATLGVQDEALNKRLDSFEGKTFLAESVGFANAYDAKKRELIELARRKASLEPWYGFLLQIAGSESAVDPAERITETDLATLITAHVADSRPVTKEEQNNPTIRHLAAILMRHSISRSDSRELPAAAGEINHDFARARLFQRGAEWAGVCYSLKDAVTFVAAFALMAASRKMDRRRIHGICLALGAIGLLSVGFIHGEQQKGWLLLALALGGVAWASILSMPYAILAGALPPERMGVYMGIFNFFIVLPEILAALFFGPLVKHLLGGNLIYAVMAGGVFMLLAAFLTQCVTEKPAVKPAGQIPVPA